MKVTAFVFLLCFASRLWAADGFTNESEAGVVAANGNTKSQTYNLKQQNSYQWQKNVLKGNGRFLKGSANDQETAFKWGAGARYERELNNDLSAFANQDLDSDKFAGYNQRHASDLGAKIYFFKSESFTWDTELGYRHTEDHRTDSTIFAYNSGRIYTEINRSWEKRLSGKLWLEYIPNIVLARDFQFNGEASFSSVLTDVFSIKTAYLLKFNNMPAVATAIKTDTLLTTSLVAKF